MVLYRAEESRRDSHHHLVSVRAIPAIRGRGGLLHLLSRACPRLRGHCGMARGESRLGFVLDSRESRPLPFFQLA